MNIQFLNKRSIIDGMLTVRHTDSILHFQSNESMGIEGKIQNM